MSDLTDIVSAMGGYQAATQQDKDALELVLGTRGGRQRAGGTPTPGVTLGTLSLSTALTSGSTVSGSILGATAGSTITTGIAGLTINSSARTFAFDGTAAAGSGVLIETLGGATNSPRSSTISIAAGAAAVAGDMTALRVRDATQMDPDSGSPAVGIDGNGWVAEVTIKGLAPPAPDNTSDGFFNCQKLELLVSDPGFRAANGDIVPATVYRKIKGRALLRKQYKTASTDVNGRFITQSGSDFTVLVALADVIYAGSTIVSAKVAAGFYTNGSAVSNASVAGSLTNASTYAYRKPTAAWLNHQHLRATGDFPVEMIAFHRHAMGGRQVAGIRFQARDTTGNVSAEQVVTATGLSAFVTASGAPKVEAFKATIPVSALAQGELCYTNAKVYPWIGDASAVYDLSVDGTYTGLTRIVDASPHTRLRFFNDKAGTYSSVALVDAGAVYTPICSASSFSPATTAFDGNYTSGNGWLGQNGGTNQWVGQTFPVAVNIEEVRIWASGYDTAKPTFNNFDLEWSDDGSTWTKKGATQVAATWTTPYTQTQTFNPGGSPRPSRYWRIRQNGSTASSFTGAQEIEFATVAGGVNMANGAAASTLADARTTPVSTPDAAWKAIRASNARKGHDDYAGRFYLSNPTSSTIEYGALAAVPIASGQLTWCEITPDPANVGSVKWTGKATTIGLPTLTRAVGLTIKPGGSNQTTFQDGDMSSNASMLSLENCVFEAPSAGFNIAGGEGIRGWSIHYRSNVTSTLGNVLNMVAGSVTVQGMALALGNVQPQGGQPAAAQIFVANRSECPSDANSGMPAYTDGYFWVANEWRYQVGPALTLLSKTRPTVIANNLGEPRGNGSGIVAFNMAADGTTQSVYELLDMHNTFVGNRGSRMYADNANMRGVPKEGVSIGSVYGNYNFKTDSFSPGYPGNTGDWRYGYQVGLRSNISLFGSLSGSAPNLVASYLGMAWEPDYSTYQVSSTFSDIMALFVNYQALRNDGGTYPGGGDYHLSSPTNTLTNRIPAIFASFNPGFTDTISGAVFSYDLDGKARLTDGTGTAGCYER